MRQFHVQNRGLQLIHPKIATNKMMLIARFHPMLPANPQSLGKLVVMTNDQAGVAPTRAMQPPVAKNEYAVVMTASPSPISSAIKTARSASVPDGTPMAC